jgi:hypothetical protein
MQQPPMCTVSFLALEEVIPMFRHNDAMCCSTCFEEMLPLLEDNGNPIAFICPNCAKIADLTDEL